MVSSSCPSMLTVVASGWCESSCSFMFTSCPLLVLKETCRPCMGTFIILFCPCTSFTLSFMTGGTGGDDGALAELLTPCVMSLPVSASRIVEMHSLCAVSRVYCARVIIRCALRALSSIFFITMLTLCLLLTLTISSATSASCSLSVSNEALASVCCWWLQHPGNGVL
jgi:hypothetical protein